MSPRHRNGPATPTPQINLFAPRSRRSGGFCEAGFVFQGGGGRGAEQGGGGEWGWEAMQIFT